VRFHEAIAQALADNGVTTVFGVLGDANLYALDSFQRQAGGRFVSMSHEAGGVLAANGYARTSKGLGVATVTHGPALTNTVTALVESVRDRTPLLLVAGDTAAADRENLQNISQRDVILPTGAGFEQVRAPHTIADDVATAIRRAFLERRPVVLNVPVDFTWEEVSYVPVPHTAFAPQAVAADSAAMERAVAVLAQAERPVILAGQGATGARAGLLRLAERLGAPLATTLRARDLFRGEPNDLGVFGGISHDVALDTLAQSDCIVAFGASLNTWTTTAGSLLAGKLLVQVDVDRSAIGRHARVDAAVIGDAAAVAEGFLARLNGAAPEPVSLPAPSDDYTDCSTAETVDIRTALTRLDATMPAERTLVLDGGRFIFHALRRLHVPEPSAYVHTTNFGSIGLGMGNAIGAAFGAPGRPVLLVAGDGGFMLGGLTEFATAIRHGLDLVTVVLNDRAYGAEHIQLRRKGIDPSISTFTWPELGPVATALGGRGFTAHNLDELDAALAAIAERDRPVLIDIKLDPDQVPRPEH